MRLMTPFIARTVARNMVKKYPGLGADAIIEKMRADMGSSDVQAEPLLKAVARYLPTRPETDTVRHSTLNNNWYSPSSLVLIIANLLPLYGVLILGWPVFPLLLLFWLENVVIGLLNALRMLLVDPGDIALWAAKLFMVPFFCFHYGMFTAVHGVLVISLFGGKAYRHLDHGMWPIEGAWHAIADFDLSWAFAALVASHVFSFVWNYLGHGEYRRTGLAVLMQQPYRRVIVLHLTIIIGGGITMALGSPLWALLLLIALKIGFDLKAHVREHRKATA